MRSHVLSALTVVLALAGPARADRGAGPSVRSSVRPDARGTVLLFHGYSTPGDWQVFGRWLHERKAFNVVHVYLPGHGGPGERAEVARLPKAAEAYAYARFNDQAFRLAAGLGKPVHVVGFSAGGAQAILAGIRHAGDRGGAQGRLASVSAVNAFLEPTPWKWGPVLLNGRIVRGALDLADRLSFGAASALADRIPYDMDGGKPWTRTEAEDRAFRHVRLGNIMALFRFGNRVEREATAVDRLPFHLFVSDDPVADPGASRRVAARLHASVHPLPSRAHRVIDERLRYDLWKQLAQVIEGAAGPAPAVTPAPRGR